MIKVSLLAVAFFFAVYGAAHGHDWYDYDCCDTRDCYPLPDDAVYYEMENGVWYAEWVSPLTGKVVKGMVAARNVRDTRDNKVHGCETSWGPPRCLYVHRGV